MERIDKIKRAQRVYTGDECVPTRQVHALREVLNYMPHEVAYLIRTDEKWKNRRRRGFRVYTDSVTGQRWIRQPWYLSLFHKPRTQYKFVSHDSEIVADALGSSELVIPKVMESPTRNYPVYFALPGSYNYRATGVRHYLADVIPVLLYRNRIGH